MDNTEFSKKNFQESGKLNYRTAYYKLHANEHKLNEAIGCIEATLNQAMKAMEVPVEISLNYKNPEWECNPERDQGFFWLEFKKIDG